MLVVDPERRFTVDQCLAHPWMTQSTTLVSDSTGGMAAGLSELKTESQGPARQRTRPVTPETIKAGTSGDGYPYKRNSGEATAYRKQMERVDARSL